jgi:hypothetical protein
MSTKIYNGYRYRKDSIYDLFDLFVKLREEFNIVSQKIINDLANELDEADKCFRDMKEYKFNITLSQILENLGQHLLLRLGLTPQGLPPTDMRQLNWPPLGPYRLSLQLDMYQIGLRLAGLRHQNLRQLGLRKIGPHRAGLRRKSLRFAILLQRGLR